MRFSATLFGVALLSSACGGDDGDRDVATTGTAGSGGIGVSGNDTGGSNASGGTGGSSAGGGSGGSSAGDSCRGAFAAPEVLFEASGSDIPNSLSITGDERELYYWLPAGVTLRARDDKASAFGDALSVPGLEGVCGDGDGRSLDVSSDGLRLYFTCDAPSGPLRVAQRADRTAPFVLSAASVGMTGTSIALSGDELRAYAVAGPETPKPLMYERASTAMPFGTASPVPGIDGAFRHPEPSDDGMALFGGVVSTGTLYRLAISMRSADGYSAPSSDGLPEPEPTASHLTPTLSADCDSLYFLSLKSAAPVTAAVMVARRQVP
jgi:hypothetical protein